MEKLTCAQAKQIDLVGYLSTLGYQPQKIRNQDYWFLSPLREEKTPSFKVNRKLNIWYDHGTGKGGSLIDFGTLYFKCTIKDLLERLTADRPSLNSSFHPPLSLPASAGEKKEASGGKILITGTRPLTDKSLLDYLAQRNLPLNIADRFCKEVDFLLYGKKYTVIGFPNNAGGYELRSADFKGSSSPKDFSLFRTTLGSKTIHVLEGFTDFLSLLSLQPELKPGNFLILNSLSFVNKSLAVLKDFDDVALYLDHDLAGRNATAAFLKALPAAKDASLFYAANKDLNDYIRHRKPQTLKQESLPNNKEAPAPLRPESPPKETRYRKGLKR